MENLMTKSVEHGLETVEPLIRAGPCSQPADYKGVTSHQASHQARQQASQQASRQASQQASHQRWEHPLCPETFRILTRPDLRWF